MQSMIRKALVVFVAALAVGVVASASASAAECKGTVEKGHLALCSEGSELLGETAFTAKYTPGTSFRFRMEPSWGEVSCNTPSGEGAFSATKTSLELKGVKMTFKGCSVPGSGCEVKNEAIYLDGGEGTGKGPGMIGALKGTSEVVLGANGKPVTKFTIQGSDCTISKTFHITGAEKCELKEGTVEAVEHTLTCAETGSTLEWGEGEGGAVKLYVVQNVKLASGKKWSLYKT